MGEGAGAGLREEEKIEINTLTSKTIDNCHRPLGPASSLPAARRALPRIPEEEEKSCPGSRSGSIGSSRWRGGDNRGEDNSKRATELSRKAKTNLKRATTKGDW